MAKDDALILNDVSPYWVRGRKFVDKRDGLVIKITNYFSISDNVVFMESIMYTKLGIRHIHINLDHGELLECFTPALTWKQMLVIRIKAWRLSWL